MKFLFKYILILPVLIFNSDIFAQKISEINIETNLKSGQIENFSGIKKGMNYFDGLKDSVQKRIENNLKSFGYYNYKILVNIDRNDTSKIIVYIKTFSSEPAFINKIQFEISDTLQNSFVDDELNSLEGKIFSSTNFENSVNEILTHYEKNGFPFAKIIVKSIDFIDDSVKSKNLVNINLKIEKGRSSKIDKIEISGNTKTKTEFIIQNLRINSGEFYDQNEIEKIPGILNRLRIFEPVEIPEYYINQNDEGILQIQVNEARTNTFDGVIGYVPDNQNEGGGYLTGLVNLSMLNLFGTGRAALIMWQQYEKGSQDLELRYLEPWIFGYPFNLELAMFQRKFDTTYVQRRYESALNFLATSTISASVFFHGDFVIPTLNENQIIAVNNSDTYTTGINFRIDNRNDFFAPTSGVIFQSGYGYSRKKIKGFSQNQINNFKTGINFQRYELDLSLFYQLFKRNVAAVSFHARELRGDQFEITDLYRLGGTNSLRGYRENQFLGSRIFWSNLEYRFQFDRRSFFFVFFDNGYFLQRENEINRIEKLSAYKTGYGAGITFQTGLGIMKVSYALGEGDNFNKGKIHFGIVNGF